MLGVTVLCAVQAAVLGQRYKCFIEPDTPLPMMYMPDCLRATWELVTAPRERLSRCTYNVTAMSFTPAQLERSIRLCYPDFQVCLPLGGGFVPVATAGSWRPGVCCPHTQCAAVSVRMRSVHVELAVRAAAVPGRATGFVGAGHSPVLPLPPHRIAHVCFYMGCSSRYCLDLSPGTAPCALRSRWWWWWWWWFEQLHACALAPSLSSAIPPVAARPDHSEAVRTGGL